MRRLIAAVGSVLAVTTVVAAGVSVASASSPPSGCRPVDQEYGGCGGTGSPPQLIAAGADGAVLGASAHGERGRVYAAWIHGGQVMLSRWNGAWGSPESVASPGAGAAGLSAAVSDDGRILVAWTQAGDVWAEVVGAAAENVSHSAAESVDPQAAYVPGLGFVVAWREFLSGDGSYTSQRGVAESRLAATGWTAPVVRYTPVPTTDSGVATVTKVEPITTRGDVLAIPFTTLDTYTVRASATALVWDGHSWSRRGFSSAGECGEAGAGLPGGGLVLAFRDCSGGSDRIATSNGADLTGLVSSPDVVGPPVVATAAGQMLVAWSQAAGVESSSSSDGVTWAAPDVVAAGGTVVSATGTADGSVFVAYTTGGGDLYSIRLDLP